MDLVRSLVVMSSMLGLWPLHGLAGPVEHPVPAVRSTAAVVREALFVGCRDSQTFRSLGRAVASAHGVVDVEIGPCRGQRGCLLHWMATAGPRRYLRVLISQQLPIDDYPPTIAHELQHAMEVLRDPRVRSAAAIYLLFLRPTQGHRFAFETEAAIATGSQVHEEMKRSHGGGEMTDCAAMFAVAGTGNRGDE